ncbi:MAG: M48 family metallopeptidase [Kiritimatiellae bacterium]|nr:M48 family metallopeptidase [Kiritimatiellia bacterium]
MSTAARQLDLFEGNTCLDPQTLLDRLNAHSHRRVTLRLTDNRVSMASIDFSKQGPIRVSLNEQYLWAPPPVIDALCAYVVTHRKADWQVVADFARQVPDRPRRVTPPRLRSKGKVYDLKALRDEVSRDCFGGAVTCHIGWGRDGAPRRRKRRSIRFGSWHAQTRTVRVHPALDSEAVPREFVRYIVFHEMLHVVVPSEKRVGRVVHHTAEFRALESRYPGFERMKKLGTQLLHELSGVR